MAEVLKGESKCRLLVRVLLGEVEAILGAAVAEHESGHEVCSVIASMEPLRKR